MASLKQTTTYRDFKMEKVITVYVVSTGEEDAKKSVNFPTKARAADAVKLLGSFGVDAKVETVKKTVTID